MQQSVTPFVRQNFFTGKREQKYRNIRAKSTGTPQVITDNSFLKQHFANIPLADVIPLTDFEKKVSHPENNMEQLIQAATGYLSLYGKELAFTPIGRFGYDLTHLIHIVTQSLPEGQLLNMDYIGEELVFVVYQPNPKRYWDTIVYIPISIAHTMRPKIKKLFIRFIAFIMQHNNLPTIKSTYDYDFFMEDVQERMKDKNDEVDESVIKEMRSYTNKQGKANRMLQQVEQCTDPRPEELLAELKNLQRLSTTETEQVQSMIRGIELLSHDRLVEYSYKSNYDNYHCDYSDDNCEETEWYDLICVSWGTCSEDTVTKFHYRGLSDRCNDFDVSNPYSYTILSPDKPQKLSPCTFPFEWLDYICNDFYQNLVTNE
jgi:hypothetical protein